MLLFIVKTFSNAIALGIGYGTMISFFVKLAIGVP
jgi:hypothetical protein